MSLKKKVVVVEEKNKKIYTKEETKNMNWYLLLSALILLGVWYYNTSVLGYPEFFASDWMGTHYGGMVWNGWNYGSYREGRHAPTPEYN